MGKMREELWRLVDRATAERVEVPPWPAASFSTLSHNRGQRRRQFRDFIKQARRASLDADIARMREERSRTVTVP